MCTDEDYRKNLSSVAPGCRLFFHCYLNQILKPTKAKAQMTY